MASSKNFDRSEYQGNDWYQVTKFLDLRLMKDPNLPSWLRVAHFHRAYMKRGGHCETSRAELADLLGCHPNNVTRAVDRAVENGYLAQGSNPNTLKAPFDVKFNHGGR